MNKTAFFFLVFLVFLTGSAFGQTENYNSALPPDVMELRAEANAATYNIDYDTARAKNEEIRKRLPYHPAGDLYLATVIWLEQLYLNHRLQTSIYRNHSSFYAGSDKAKIGRAHV